MESKSVDLGFSEEQEPWLLTNRFFPSKIGGKAAWLELGNIPEAKDLSCDYCGETCIFLCQVYAAGLEKISHAFHRSIFVFICRNGQCCGINQSGNIKVLRSQLPQKNKFYSDTPPDDSVEMDGVEPLCKICNVCGCKAPLVCGKCKKASYCGQPHQKMDWKYHKRNCGGQNDGSKNGQNETGCYLFPEYEIIIEREEDEAGVKKSHESEKESESRRLREFEEMVEQGKIVHNSEITENDLKEFEDSKEDKAFGKFKKAIEKYPQQVIRYNRHGEPLWISGTGILNKSNIPNCTNCNGKRTFEFQIMPQMLNDLENYDLDWGIISIFTCQNDCFTNEKYIQEFCYKQDVTRSNDDPITANVDRVKISEHSTNFVPTSKEIQSPKESDFSKKPKASSLSKNKRGVAEECSKKAFKESDNWE